MHMPLPARLLSALVTALLLASAPAFGADRAVEKSVPLPEHGTFRISIPAVWKDEVIQKPGLVPPSIAIHPAKGKAFEISVAPLWRPRPDVPLPTRDTIREQLEHGIEQIKTQAVEQDIKLIEFQGASGPGFYFTATDKSSKPAGYKHLTQGLLVVSELLVVFTVLSNGNKEPLVRDVVTMMKSAKHEPPQ